MEVWAPKADQVELVLDATGERLVLRATGEGWYRLDRPLPPETEYWVVLDGGERRPDPRSPSQPRGIDGPSRTVDHAAFRWTDRRWHGFHLPSAVLYELHVGTFTDEGTFDGAIRRLDHLVELGIDAIEVMPVAEFAGRWGWGYDGVALFAPHHEYGGPPGFKRLVDAAHQRGLGVVLDVVYNHLGPTGNHLSEFGPYFNDAHQTPWGAAVNLDGPGSGPVREFFVANARQWFDDYHVDGLRLDAVHALVDHSALPFLEELRADIDALAAHLRRPLWLVAEDDRNDPRIVTAPAAGGYGLDAVWADDLHHALHVALTGEKDGYYADYDGVPDLARALEEPYVFDGRPSAFRGSRRGRSPGDLDGHRFVVCAQNHDQVGNRPRGERLSRLVDPPGLMIAAALVLCSPYTPLLFQGEEWAASTPFLFFADFADPELARAVREGRRNEFAGFDWAPEEIPDPMVESAFVRSKLDWHERHRSPHREVLAWYRALLALRRSRADLSDGRRDRTSVDYDTHGEVWLALRREHTSVAVNFDLQPRVVPLPTGRWEVLLASVKGARLLAEGVVVPGHGVAIAGRAATPVAPAVNPGA